MHARSEGLAMSHDSDHVGSHAATSAQYHAAEQLLQSAEYMLGVERQADALDVSAPPTVVSFAEGDQLRTAARTGLFAGSYNPLTYAHVAVADAARTQARLDDVVWAISRVTVDKERVTSASVHDRLAQLVAFT